MIFTFSPTVSDAMAAAHSGSSLVTFLSNNPPSIRITCGVTCTVLSSNERLFIIMRESSCWTRFERSNRSKGTGSLLDKIFTSAAFALVTQDALELNVQTYLTISLREALHKFLCPETRIPPLSLPDWLASAPIFHRILFSYCAILSCGSHPILLSIYQCNSDSTSRSSTRITLCCPRVT